MTRKLQGDKCSAIRATWRRPKQSRPKQIGMSSPSSPGLHLVGHLTRGDAFLHFLHFLHSLHFLHFHETALFECFQIFQQRSDRSEASKKNVAWLIQTGSDQSCRHQETNPLRSELVLRMYLRHSTVPTPLPFSKSIYWGSNSLIRVIEGELLLPAGQSSKCPCRVLIWYKTKLEHEDPWNLEPEWTRYGSKMMGKKSDTDTYRHKQTNTHTHLLKTVSSNCEVECVEHANNPNKTNYIIRWRCT